MSSPDALVFEDVTKSFDGRRVLDGLSAEVPLTGITFVVGKSGSGKSVLCRLAVGLLRPDAGRITLMGESVHDAPERKLQRLRVRAPYLVQGPALLDWLTLSQNVALAVPEGTAHPAERVVKALERVGLLAWADRHPPTLGPGARKRAAIARALVGSPSFLFLDEPTTGLDRAASFQVNELIAALGGQGLGAMVVSHDYRALEALADRVLLVSDGKVGFLGPKQAFLTSELPQVRALLSAR